VRSQERDDVGGGAEGVGDRCPVAQGQGGAQLAIQLGHKQRLGRKERAVERRQSDERQMVIGVARADGDLGAQRVHVAMVTRSWHKGK
jgi:hypothetical protein